MNIDQALKLSGNWFSDKSSDNVLFLEQFHLEWLTLKIPWNNLTNTVFPPVLMCFQLKQDIVHGGAYWRAWAIF